MTTFVPRYTTDFSLKHKSLHNQYQCEISISMKLQNQCYIENELLANEQSGFKCSVNNYFFGQIKDVTDILNLLHFRSALRGRVSDFDYYLQINYTNMKNQNGNRKVNFPSERKTDCHEKVKPKLFTDTLDLFGVKNTTEFEVSFVGELAEHKINVTFMASRETHLEPVN
ncbi:uncharacterized protein LOC116350440 [Contarinia nasturtii]|uniref:uncharacterized protein LOC116350440 n=1 Tax=Contarinia nasturtii TaxID=265458 RepID=UPI0012D44F4E|nr:uncharacterized protein LOC116350440 [Contarinia nasturtii]